MKLKVCGITQTEQLHTLEAIGVDFVGFIFYEKSPRFVPFSHIKKEKFGFKKIGVFVNAKPHFILERITNFQLDMVQLHGAENPDFCETIRRKIPVIKAFGIETISDFEQLKAYEKTCDYFLLDTRTKKYGGSGKKFNWALLNTCHIHKPFFLSGGIEPKDASTIKNLMIKNLFALDINSKFEKQAGIKDMEKIKRFYGDIKKI